MSKVPEQLNFMWPDRVLDYFNEFKHLSVHETKGYTPYTDAMRVIETVLKLQGLHVKGIEN